MSGSARAGGCNSPRPLTSEHKFNAWCERRALVCSDEEILRRANLFFSRNDLLPSERAAFYLHELTGCDGLEFVAFSNAKLSGPVTLAEAITLVPCFLNQLEGRNAEEPLVRFTIKMARECRFIYDGWAPIAKWNVENVRRCIRSVDEALSIFSLRSRCFFDWKPKYPAPTEAQSYYNFEDRHLTELERVVKALDSMDNDSRTAIYRSLGWLSQGLRLAEPVARFFFSVLAIEAFATYVEKDAPDQSIVAFLRAEQLTRGERVARREQCITDTLAEWLSKDSTKAVVTAYSNCVVGLGKMLRNHLERIMGPDSETVALLFEQVSEGKPLYSLRHEIAHGRLDALSEAERDKVRQRVWDVERIARQYILTLLEKVLGFQISAETMTASMPLNLQSGVASREGMYKGPTHMGIVYS